MFMYHNQSVMSNKTKVGYFSPRGSLGILVNGNMFSTELTKQIQRDLFMQNVVQTKVCYPLVKSDLVLFLYMCNARIEISMPSV